MHPLRVTLVVSLVIALVAAPFALGLGPLSTLIDSAHVWRVSDPNLSQLYAEVAAGFILVMAGSWNATGIVAGDNRLNIRAQAQNPLAGVQLGLRTKVQNHQVRQAPQARR